MNLIFTFILLLAITLILTLLITIVAAVRKLMGKLFWKSFKAGLWILLVPPLALLYGAFIERNQTQTNSVEIVSENVPQAFDGYKIVHISDIHLLSFIGREDALARIVEKINAQQPDAILFTGDLVTQNSSEFESTKDILAKLRATDGVYSILGNHDYSFYNRWESEELRKKDADAIVGQQRTFGWNLLLNENRSITRNINDGEESISIIGVENISTKHKFRSYGNLAKAAQGAEGKFKILLTHDPSHWRTEVLPKTNIDLTLSGHTHAMQSTLFGWSIISFIYKEYMGLYKEGNRFLYVNIGLGETMFPFRVGAKPEITVITLKSGSAE
ncbi:MAG: metallophosphoesterase [Bacteroidaceae bacterium]|nr:metallophosphoesterase [Bacteroidaceae bacterium]